MHTNDTERRERKGPTQICVIGTNRIVRDAVSHQLDHLSIPWVVLREDAGMESDRVKISTIESAKGHEFVTVFIVGLIEGVLPQRNVTEEDIPREAARLYVAMTRARDTLYLSYTSNMQIRPSPFLASIQKDCFELEYHNHEFSPID